MKLANLIASGLFIVFSLGVTIAAYLMPYTDEYGLGYGFMPLWVGIVMSILSFFWLVQALKLNKTDTKFYQDKAGAKRVLTLGLAILATVFLINNLGFFTSIILLVLFIIVIFEKKVGITRVTSLVGLGTTILFIYLIFEKLFGTAFPHGFIV